MPANPQADIAASYGWSLAVLNSDAELKRLFGSAVAETWTPDKFVAAVRNTKWFKSRTERQRQNFVLQRTDPNEYKRRLRATLATVKQVAGQLGSPLAAKSLTVLTKQAFELGWSEQELRQHIADTPNWVYHLNKNVGLSGQAGQLEGDIRKTARAYGLRLSNSQIGSYMDKILQGTWTQEKYIEDAKNIAKNTYRGYADQIDAGKTVDEIVEPFRQSMANVLEINPAKLDAYDPTIRKAMTYIDPASKKPAAVPLWQFEENLRKDSRWMNTDNGKKAFGSLTRGLLQSWGLVS